LNSIVFCRLCLVCDTTPGRWTANWDRLLKSRLIL